MKESFELSERIVSVSFVTVVGNFQEGGASSSKAQWQEGARPDTFS